MAWRLGGSVVRGELFNLRLNSVHGWIELRDHESPLRLELTGNFDESLGGKHLRFEARDAAAPASGAEQTNGAGVPLDVAELEPMQVGPTGDMILRQVHAPPANRDVPCLHLEWFSQNGRIVLELLDPILEFVENEEDDDLDDEADESGLNLSALSLDDDSDLFGEAPDDDDDLDDPFGLFPDDLEEQLAGSDEPEGTEGEPSPRGRSFAEVDEETQKQWALWDEMFEGKHDVPIQTIFDPPLRLYPSDKLDDAQVAQALRLVLARLAEYGIALNMCEHYSPREAYELLLDEILPNHGTYPRLRATGFVQHYMTSDFCPKCDAEFEERWEREKESNGHDEGNDGPADDEQTY
jgi:hypothetical protein